MARAKRTERAADADTTRGAPPRQARTAPLDVLIAGGGLVGLALALALDHESDGALSVAVVDPAGAEVPKDARSSAIAAGARRMLETLSAWPDRRAQPILDMIVTDGRVEDAVRPAILTFGGEAEPGEPFAHMVENTALIGALLARARARGIAIEAGAVERVERDGGLAVAVLADGRRRETRLVAACDGARSRLRQQAGIRMHGWDYGQSGIVATLIHERPHGGRAEEHFLPAGPFAILPLVDDADGRPRSSIVWTERTSDAERIVASPDAAFHEALMERFGHHLGAVALAGPRRAHPLGLKLATRWVEERLALVGDAAHVVHPIAGQGLNLGLKDVAALSEVLVEAAMLGEDPGSLGVLERYERWRRFDAASMGVTTDVLNRLFSNDIGPLRGLRDFGLGLVERLPPLKGFFIRNAAGLTGEIPRLMRRAAV